MSTPNNLTEYSTETRCPEAPHGCHEPDFSTLRVAYDGGEAYLDVSCIYCGRDGCIAGPKQLGELKAGVCW